MRRPALGTNTSKAIAVSSCVVTVQKALPLVAIADAHRIVSQALKEIIFHDGRFNPVVAVSTGREFLKATEGEPIAVGIICWSLPDMTAGDVLLELSRRRSKIRIIVYSGEDGDRALREAVRLGAWGFASKRTEPSRLLDVIATVASGRPALPYVDLQTLARNPLAGLTERERDLLSSLANGWSNQQIAERFGISRNTVKYHLKNLYEKLDVDNRTMAVALLHRAASDGPCST